MACGLGPCYVCVRTFEVNGKKELRRVCIEGPVFDMQEAVGWYSPLVPAKAGTQLLDSRLRGNERKIERDTREAIGW